MSSASATSPVQRPGFMLCFASLYQEGRALAFPCDATGRVDLDGLSETARRNYLYARAVMGMEYAHPRVEPLLN
ncbi:hypothetical protein [Aquabacterium sp. J223]|uniref:hypothetical protein n=1 Tax=Aquabacterium sp. J223 TaxID=2898431 RepID=UPI0021AE120E|nr:hypothetical protein [Aquabacterium sp. J223]UUX94774.1 hypothetical protein LRS07_16020 [Aquabacterium sp. J223]